MRFFMIIFIFLYLIGLNKSDEPKHEEHPKEMKNEFIPCGKAKCIISQGFCRENKKSDIIEIKKECICYSSYSTIENEKDYHCNYLKKTQIKAFLLEFILSNGAGHFYLENYYIAVPKLLLWIFSYYFFITLRITCKGNEENNKVTIFLAILACIFCFGMLTWQIFDLVLFALNQYKDSNGIELKSWFDNDDFANF